MGVKVIRIYQLDGIVNARLEMVGGFFEVEVPAGPVAGGYQNKRLSYEQLADLLGGATSPNHSKSLLKSYRYLTRAEVAAGGNFGEAFEDLDFNTCCINTRIKVDFYQPAGQPMVFGQWLVAVWDSTAYGKPERYVYVDGSFRPGDKTPAKFVPLESQEAQYGYVRRDTSPATITNWRVGELSIWALNGTDQFATAKQAGGVFPAFTGVEDAYWKPAAKPVPASAVKLYDTLGDQTDGAPTNRLLKASLEGLNQRKPFLGITAQGVVGFDTFDDTQLGGATTVLINTSQAELTTDVLLSNTSIFGQGETLHINDGYQLGLDRALDATGAPTLIKDLTLTATGAGYISVETMSTVTAALAPRLEGGKALAPIRFVGKGGLVLDNCYAASITNDRTATASKATVFLIGTASIGTVGANVTVVQAGAGYDDTALKARLGATTSADPATPLSAVKNVLSQSLTLADAQAAVTASSLLPGRTYIVDFGFDANNKSQLVYASALQTNLFNRYATLILGNGVISQVVANFRTGALEPVASGTSYTAGTGIDLTNNVISTKTVLRPALRVSSGVLYPNATAQPAPAGQFLKVTGYSQVEREVGSTAGTGWDAANQQYIVPAGGEYQVAAVGQLQPGASSPSAVFYHIVYVNDVRTRDLFIQACPSNQEYYGGAGTTDLSLDAGDRVDIRYYHSGGDGSQLIQSNVRCAFSIRQLPS